jgi:hypothetical protein
MPWKPANAGGHRRQKRFDRREGTFQAVRLTLELLEDRTALSGNSLGAVYGQVPISFEPNVGQTDSQIGFLSHGSGYNLYLNASGAVLGLQSGQTNAKSGSNANSQAPNVLQMKLVGADPAAPATGMDKQAGISNYFLGNDPSKWFTNVPNYAQVRYHGVYPGVDAIYYGNQSQLEYDFRVAPGANPANIQLRFAGAQGMSLDGPGNLVLHTAGGNVVEHAPVLYQQVNGVRRAVAGSYVLDANGRVGFRVGPYDRTRELVIDPVLSYSTYLGGSGRDAGTGIAVDNAGNAYITGSTQSTDFPIVNGFQSSLGTATTVSYVAKLNAAGTALMYSTYLGGDGQSFAFRIAVDSSGDAYVTGQTSSTNFPTVNAILSSNPSQFSVAQNITGFVTKLNANGSALVYSTYLGGNGQHGPDQGVEITVSSSGNAYIVGGTGSTNFPLVNALQTNIVDVNGFVAEINAAGTAFVFSTYLGGSRSQNTSAIALDSTGAIYVCGSTSSPDFPVTANAIQTTFHGVAGSTLDAYVTKLSPGGASIVYSTFLGGNDEDDATGIAVDSAGNAFIAGQSYSTDFPTVNAFQSTLGGGEDEFVAKINAAGTALIYSTYLGGNKYAFSGGIAIDSAGDAYVGGSTSATNFPTVNAFQTANAGGPDPSFNYDGFISELNPAGNALLFSTYLGGNGNDGTGRIALDSSGNLYVAGYTSATNFPTVNALQASNPGGQTAIVAKITFATNQAPAITSANNTAITVGAAGSFTVTATGFPAPSFTESGALPGGVTFVNGLLSGTPASGTAGTFNLTITASNGVGTNATQSFALTINQPIAVQAVQINDGSAQRAMVNSITINFSRAVGTVDDGAFKVTAQQAGGDPTVVVTWNAARTAATLTFTGSLIVAGSLQDGRFSLVIDSTKIHDASGGLLDGDGDGLSGGARAADAFFRLFGDSDGDGDVDNLDLFRFRQSFGLTSADPNYKSYFDFDGDGDVDNLDLFHFRQRFGTTLA